ncbi:MAG TPA: AMP-binding protein [Trebonia sp.]|jgi:long-chain acyl-CoA synthetase|nr:AMP-binding protein [Trebonia sp.]
MGDYDERPWRRLYQPGRPSDITPPAGDALSLWRAGAGAPGRGSRPFLHYFGTPVTAATVDADSDALAAGLAARGVRRGDRIALYLQNVPQFVIGLLAAWKLGAIAVPVNPMLKERELRYVLRDSGARAIISHHDVWDSVASAAVPGTEVAVAVTTSPLEYLGEDVPAALASAGRAVVPGAVELRELLISGAGTRPAPVTLRPDDIALLTYTSGTTGEPKGAMNTHGNVVFNACAYRDWIGLTPDDVVLAGAPLFHITGLIGHAAVAMLVPMPMVLGYRFDAATMIGLAERHRATYTIMAITAFTALMSDPALASADLSSLAKVYSGGAPIAPSIVERFEREAGPYIHNIYGLTETTSPSHAVPFGRRAPVDPESGALSVGVPVFNTVSRIVDDAGKDVPPGEIGEIATSGPMVVPGYWNRPSATAATLPGGELRTGDVGFMDADGWFYLVDRKKDMIVASGFKVWPREVEDTLLRHPAVREAAVIGVPDSYRGETVWAYVSLRPGTSATPEELTGFCRDELAAYKYPRRIEILPDLPKTPTGKLLRRELRDRAAGGR